MSDRAAPFSIVIDANVLAGALTRNIVLSFAEAGFFGLTGQHAFLTNAKSTLRKRPRVAKMQNANAEELRRPFQKVWSMASLRLKTVLPCLIPMTVMC